MDGILVCGQMTRSVGPLAKWPGSAPVKIPYHFDYSGYRGPLTQADLDAAFAKAWQYWADVVQVEPVPVESRAAAKVWGTFKRIDGPSNVLAWSMLADNTDSPKEQRYDAGDTWIVMNPETPTGGGIDLVRVAHHEIGHVLGLDHDAPAAEAVMRPSYSTRIPKCTPRDVQRLIGLGYKARALPVPPSVPDPPPVAGWRLPLPGGGHLTAEFDKKEITYPVGWVGRTI